jgi:uncharacterized protein YqhQ
MKSPTDTPKLLLQYGGQAVIEGVMMRGRRFAAIAVRKPDKEIAVRVQPLGGVYTGTIARIPFLRGVLMLWDSFGLGMESLSYSAGIQGEKPVSRGEWALSLTISLVILVGVFFLGPTFLGEWLENNLGVPAWTGALAEGALRLILFLGYLIGIGRLPDIARVFAYHGAEHKTINAYEAGANLTPESVERYSVAHPRCGTSFLVTLIALSILIFTLLGPMPFGWKILARVVIIAPLISLGYEYLRLTAAVKNPVLARILTTPGKWTQRLTTRPPDREMLAVAIAAFTAMRAAEEDLPRETPAPAGKPEDAVPHTE